MRRLLAVVAMVLVLGAWGPCAPPINGGDDVATTDAEGWQYVGDVDQPDFEGSWTQISGGVLAAARLRDEGTVDVAAGIEGGTNGSVAWTLPDGYRPDDVSPPIIGVGRETATGAETIVRFIPQATGELVVAWDAARTVDQVTIQGQFFLQVPGMAP